MSGFDENHREVTRGQSTSKSASTADQPVTDGVSKPVMPQMEESQSLSAQNSTGDNLAAEAQARDGQESMEMDQYRRGSYCRGRF